ncbi:MAG: PadR family transcriptional regulator [Terriglobales bacterium]
MSKSANLVPGTLDLLILRTLEPEPQHGWGIAQRIHLVSQQALQVRQGALYPALHRLEEQGWVRAEWRDSENNRRAKYYALTRAGRRFLAKEQANWERLTAAIGMVLHPKQG